MSAAGPDDDPHLWLEDVTGECALQWVRARNELTSRALAQSADFHALQARLLSILDSQERIAYIARQGAFFYNFWRDGDHVRGLWRRTTLEEYRRQKPAWDVVLDLDALGAAEGENWVWHGAQLRRPDRMRALVSLSRGGADATVVREFDMETRRFVPDGFALPESKGRMSWRDADSVYVGPDLGPDSMTQSGYPRLAMLWRRGTPLRAAELVFEGRPTDLSVSASRDHTPGFERDFVGRGITFYASELFWLRDGRLVRIDKPEDAGASIVREWLLLALRSDWDVGGRTHRAGSLLATRLAEHVAGERRLDVLFEPGPRTSLADFSATRHALLLNVLDNVRNRIFVLRHERGGWTREPLAGVPDVGSVAAWPVDSVESDDCFLQATDERTPTTLLLGTLRKGSAAGATDAEGVLPLARAAEAQGAVRAPSAGAPELLASLPAFFDATGVQITWHEATSDDGTAIPYCQVGRRPAAADGRQPTILTGYGGFEISLTPGYKASVGAGWLERGGAYVVANIRGGGEFGPAWHQAALKAKRHKAYEDFAAVARDLIARRVTCPAHLGCEGGSNGGLLVGNMLSTWPELFGAIVCRAPLLDMRRYTKLLAGASWVAEYGDPDDPADWEHLQRYSPYHCVRAGRTYPPVLFLGSTRDDRVHPGHARKMAARHAELGHAVLSWENIEGGHGGSANNAQAAFMSALAFAFLWKHLR
ncbi:MAG TPA: prolyl oligopeptidase family serine peptidase [Planctomycetota bacterium]|nr:prolyl oligopeptidase family serine peptidase [Planctomycetota bacterium]